MSGFICMYSIQCSTVRRYVSGVLFQCQPMLTNLAVQVVDDNLGFTKDRTVSRLIDMQSREYLTQHAEKHAPELLLALHDRKGNRRSKSTSRHERGGLRSSVH